MTGEDFARAVRVGLAETGMKKQDLAEQLGVSPSGLSKRLSGRVAFSPLEQQKAKRILGLGRE